MRLTRWLAGIGAVVLIVLGATAPSQAKSKPKYRYKLTGTLHMDWQWPVNQFNKGRRDSDSFDVQKGTGCGTKPTRAIWNVTSQSGDLPAQTLLIDFVHGVNKNPAKVTDANYAGTPTADVQIYLGFSGGKTPKATLTAQPHGDIIGPNINPATAGISAKRVKKC